MLHQPLMLAEEAVAVIAVAGGLLVAIAAIIAGAIRQSIRAKEREQSRREIAAYIAEGSMSAAEGERLMSAGERPKDC